MLDYKRSDRVAALIQREISDIIQRRIKDPRVGFCTVTRVDVSDDLRYANVRVGVMGDEVQCESSMAGLKNAAGFVRREIGKRLSLRYTPEIRFILDKSVDYILTVDRLIKEVKLTPEAIQERFVKTIDHVNSLIENIAPEGYKEKWKVGVAEGTVAFGSAFHNWALSFPYM